MRIDRLVTAINAIDQMLDQAEAAGDGARREQLLREAAVTACRAFSEAMSEGALDELEEEMRACPDEAFVKAQELLVGEESFADLVRAEARLLGLLGVRPNVVERLQGEMREVDREFDPSSLGDVVRELRQAVCELPERLQGEAKRERRKKKIWGGVMGLAGLVTATANGPFVLIAPPAAAASFCLGGAVAAEGLNRVLRDK